MVDVDLKHCGSIRDLPPSSQKRGISFIVRQSLMLGAEYGFLSSEQHSLPYEDTVVRMLNTSIPARRILISSRLFLGMNT